ncbi:uncharacterized protein LY79DRAFT_633081 [Colletotrichum navitas]|uniref:Uncharacterized protein n=1 Tax=Colletotrichum navitas TaxID=681940 RepID=A0AAD8V4F9_9PEZI|nr:uncharacterized protein LY79DRAFT_633081 [Colletotrichum navitas]KAK1590251.1 hypothetical protein LY79DRAFT_633081 [Colletotrichum navitas]
MVNFWITLTLFLNAHAVASHILRPAPVADIQSDNSARALQDRGLGQGSRRAAQKSCGDYNFVFTGLPWNHPSVKASGFTPEQVEAGLRADMKAIVDAGYNIKAVLVGPENSLDDISSELKGVNWTGTGVGFGVRGNPSPVITRRLIDIIQLYRDEVPQARILFNYSPNSTVWAIQQYFPSPSSLGCQCGGPGKDLGIAIHCSACSPPV